jgi:crotonobetainyl-CoA:carnitine CoA-transferase CaiB-like acyl-CoA transferase
LKDDYFSFTGQLFNSSAVPGKPEVLKQIRVLDLSRIIFGPMVAKWLGLFGAEIIKVEEPRDGDAWRSSTYWGKYWKDSCPYFQCINMNKYFIAIDLKEKKGKELVLELAKKSDVVIENFRAGLVEAWGIGYAAVSKVNPKAIYISCSGYGQSGPLKYYPSYDIIAQSVSGAVRSTGFPERNAYKLPDYYGDFFPAVLGAIGVMAALHDRERTGKGQYIDMAQTEAIMRAMFNWTYMSETGNDLGCTGNYDPTMAPSGIFKTKDGKFVAIAIATQEQFLALLEVMEKPELAERKEFQSTLERLKPENAREINVILKDWVDLKTEKELVDLAKQRGIPVGRVVDDLKIVNDEWRRERGSVVDFEDEMYGKGKWAGPAVSLSKSPARIKWLSRPVGYHNRYIFKKVLGLSESEIKVLEKEDIIGYWDNMAGKRPPHYLDIAKDKMFNYEKDDKK